jgi:hypothetical protein
LVGGTVPAAQAVVQVIGPEVAGWADGDLGGEPAGGVVLVSDYRRCGDFFSVLKEGRRGTGLQDQRVGLVVREACRVDPPVGGKGLGYAAAESVVGEGLRDLADLVVPRAGEELALQVVPLGRGVAPLVGGSQYLEKRVRISEGETEILKNSGVIAR